MATILLTEAFTTLVPHVGQVVVLALAAVLAVTMVALTAKAWVR